MLPLQDVVPTRQIPAATLALIAVNAVVFAAQANGAPALRLTAPFTHNSIGLFLIGILLLWLFGDNVEARLGRAPLVLIYLLGGLLPGLAATGAVTAVLGSYFVLLPRSRVLTLVPLPPVLVEVPAAFFLGVWAALHLLTFVTQPRTLWIAFAAFGLGAAGARLMQRPITW